MLLVSTALTVRLVAVPPMVSPLAEVRFLMKPFPVCKLVIVNWTVILAGLMPAEDPAVNDRVEDGSNMYAPSGYTLAIVGWALAAFPRKMPAETSINIIKTRGMVRGIEQFLVFIVGVMCPQIIAEPPRNALAVCAKRRGKLCQKPEFMGGPVLFQEMASSWMSLPRLAGARAIIR